MNYGDGSGRQRRLFVSGPCDVYSGGGGRVPVTRRGRTTNQPVGQLSSSWTDAVAVSLPRQQHQQQQQQQQVRLCRQRRVSNINDARMIRARLSLDAVNCVAFATRARDLLSSRLRFVSGDL